MNNQVARRYFYSFIIVTALTCISIEAYFCITGSFFPLAPHGTVARVIFYFSFFTVLSTLALSVGCLLVIVKPTSQYNRLAILRIDGIVGVIITGIVYNLVLRGMYQPHFWVLKITTECLHVLVPILGVIGWIVFDPHPALTKRTVGYSLIPPVIYVIYVFIRGAITGLYPYPILDVNQIGYEHVLINLSIITLCFIIFTLLFYWVNNHWLKDH